MTTRSSRPPAHLSLAARRLWAAILGTYELEPHHRALLTKALEAMDRADQARAEIGAGPLLITSRLGALVPHPLLSVERDARAQFATIMRGLGLDVEGPPPPSSRKVR
jgi:P27 family predicted phage terminase small subunit